eukprot:TRINITY_DN117_c1_g4_i1.p1 TRINITY_DN117_c1_g4~~TRINITY_DN117_c1_g4_i1.p1  ORF type:complete len:306 (+),score=180.24 TRINITY_DN117_c1_g4_i1:80-997(+)
MQVQMDNKTWLSPQVAWGTTNALPIVQKNFPSAAAKITQPINRLTTTTPPLTSTSITPIQIVSPNKSIPESFIQQQEQVKIKSSLLSPSPPSSSSSNIQSSLLLNNNNNNYIESDNETSTLEYNQFASFPNYSAEDFIHLTPNSSVRWQMSALQQQQQNQQNQQNMKALRNNAAAIAAANIAKLDDSQLNLYKTELCRSFEETGICRYGTKCQFAHGSNELRPVSRHPKYKTEICKTFSKLGTCPYGKRCCFIHQINDVVLNSVTSAAAAVTQQQQLQLQSQLTQNQIQQSQLQSQLQNQNQNQN